VYILERRGVVDEGVMVHNSVESPSKEALVGHFTGLSVPIRELAIDTNTL
jgi:hypothetical protein